MNDTLRVLLAIARQLTFSGPDREAYERLVLDHTPHGTPIRDRPVTGYTVDGVPVSNPTPAADMAHAEEIAARQAMPEGFHADGGVEWSKADILLATELVFQAVTTPIEHWSKSAARSVLEFSAERMGAQLVKARAMHADRALERDAARRENCDLMVRIANLEAMNRGWQERDRGGIDVGPEPSDDDIDVMKEYLREYCADGVTEYMDGLAAGAYRIAAERRPSPPSPIDWERAMWVLRSAYWGGLKEIEPVSEWDIGDKEDWRRVAESAQGLFGGANAAPAIPEAVRERAREIARELPSDDALREFVPEGVDFPHSERSAVFVAAALVRELAGAP